MSTGWTGGQYSLHRALLGAAVTVQGVMLACAGPPSPVTALSIVVALFGVLLAVGHHDRVCAVAIVATGAYLALRHFRMPTPVWAYLGLLLLAHVCVPSSPYGSWAARGREDPAGTWRLPDVVWFAVWIVAAPPLAPLLAWRRARPVAWMLSLAAHGTALVILGHAAAIPAALLLHVLLFDPAWVAPLASPAADTIYYDGHCGLCHRAVRFLLAEDRSGAAFRFAPLDSASFVAALDERERRALPDSLVVKRADGSILVRALAVRHIALRLGGLWRCLATAAALVPHAVLDRLYDGVARVRRRLFPAPPEACPLVPAHLRSRFVTD